MKRITVICARVLLAILLVTSAILWRRCFDSAGVESLAFGRSLSLNCWCVSAHGEMDFSLFWFTKDVGTGLVLPAKGKWFWQYSQKTPILLMNGLADPSAGYYLPILGRYLTYERASKAGVPVLYVFSATVPYWLILACGTLIPLALWYRRARRKSYRARHNLCPTCGYDLRATPEKCPECGTPIIPGPPIS